MSAPNALGKKVLREYSGILDDGNENRLEAIKREALKIYHNNHRRSEKFLDLDYSFGQELRQLVVDGTPNANTYSSDLHGGFFTVGYELFKDKERPQTTCIEADIFDDTSPLTALAGQTSFVYVGDLFHLFSLENQGEIARRIDKLLVSTPGALVLGRQSGSEVSGGFSRSGDRRGWKSYGRSPESWKELWGCIGREPRSDWAVEADLSVFEFSPGASERGLASTKSLRCTIRRL